MEYKTFKNSIKTVLQKRLGEDFSVNINEARKNNGIIRTGIYIMSKETNIAPTIYLEPYYNEYENGRGFGDIVDEILLVYHNNAVSHFFDVNYVNDYDCVKDKLFVRLCNTEKNEKLLNTVPNIPFYDLSIIFYIELDECFRKGATLIVNDSLVDSWRVDTKILMNQALKNSATQKEIIVKSLFDFVLERENVSPELADALRRGMNEMNSPEIYYMTNSKLLFGASVILYPKALERLSNELGANLFIIPSSIHELLLIPDDYGDAEDESNESIRNNIKEMIKTVNDTEVKPEDILSYSLYYYDRLNKKVSII